MSARFEQNIKEWYSNSRTVSLEYLDLATVAEPKPSEIANNLGVIYDRVSLLSKVSLKHFYTLKTENQKLRDEVFVLKQAVSSLEKEVVSLNPLTTEGVRSLILEIAQQPNLIEEEARRLTKELQKSVRKVEGLLEEVRRLIGG